jgi:hypothetical protein
VTYWHGGGRILGDHVRAGDVVGTTRAAGDGVYVTTDRTLAETYASTAEGPAWIYEVEPIGELTPTPPLIGGPTISYRCAEARIIRRFTISNARRRRLAEAVPGWAK